MNINFMSAINTTGYGTCGMNILSELILLGEKVSFFNVTSGIECYSQDEVNIITLAVNNAENYDINAPCLQLWHLPHINMFVGRGPKIGFPIFELDSFSSREKINVSVLDRMFVTSKWAKDIVTNNISSIKEDKIDVVNLGHNVGRYPELLNVARQPGPFRFFTCGKWEKRKGHDVICEAFNKAFDEKDDVELHLMCGNHTHLNQDQELTWKNKFLMSKNGSKVRFIERVPLQKQVFEIMAQMDCGLFPARAEGWNLELMEMMALNKPVITTNCSAHTEYCNKENSYLIDVGPLEPAFDDKWFNGRMGSWASVKGPQIDQMVTYMRKIYNERPRNESGGKEIRETYTWRRTAERISGILRNI